MPATQTTCHHGSAHTAAIVPSEADQYSVHNGLTWRLLSDSSTLFRLSISIKVDLISFSIFNFHDQSKLFYNLGHILMQAAASAYVECK